MKIQYALMSCNSEMDYLGYWPLVAAAWRKLGITPVLFFIRDSDNVKPPPADGIVHEMEPLPDVNMAVQFTWARFWGARRYPDDVVTISDMDALPLSRDYFVGQLRNIPDDKYVHLGSLFYIPRDKQASLLTKENLAATDIDRFSVQFHAARGSLLAKVLALPDDWGQAAREVAPYYEDIEKYISPYADVWHGDELYPTRKIHDYQKQSVFVPLLREKTHPPVAEKGRWGQIIRKRYIDRLCQCVCDAALLKQDYYLYIHCPRPCTPQTLALMNFLLENNQSSPPSLHGKIERLLAMEKKYLKHQEKPTFRIFFWLRLLPLAYFARNRSPIDAACSQWIKSFPGQELWARLRPLLRKSVPIKLWIQLRRLRNSLIPGK